MHSRPSASKGSGLEIIIPDDTNVGQFIPAWVRAAGDAQGTCTKVCADLEGLECQNELINMINDSSTGIAKARKGLTALLSSGSTPTTNDVRLVLQEAWSLTFCLFRFMVRVIAFSRVFIACRPRSLSTPSRSTRRLASNCRLHALLEGKSSFLLRINAEKRNALPKKPKAKKKKKANASSGSE